jgi:cyclopropane fatty-acyl-phospholipid synthase-like methyltransferase
MASVENDSSQINTKSYNRIADQWAIGRIKSPILRPVIQWAAELKPGSRILDIGCGVGYPIDSYLLSKGFTIHGIDSSPEMIRLAQLNEWPLATYEVCDFFDFYPKGTYGGIVAFDSLFHFPLARQREIYHRVADWMEPGALFVFTHGLEEGEKTGSMANELFYYSSLDRSEVFHLLHLAGFEILWWAQKFQEQNWDRDLIVIARKK